MPALTHLQYNIIEGLLFVERDLGNPTFAFNGTNYPFIPSISEFKRELDTGGFALIKLLQGTVRILNKDGTNQFTTLPTAQQKITYSIDGLAYRIETIKIDPTNTHFRMIAEGIAKGI